jgi:hypothetical protein
VPSSEPSPQPSTSADQNVHPLVVPGLIGGSVAAVLIAMFWIATTPAYRAHTLGSFIALVVIVTGALLAAMARPRLVGHVLSGGFGLASLLAGVMSLTGSLPPLLALVLVVMGAFTLLLTAQSLTRRSRAAWAFLSAVLAVMAVCTLFGAPKIHTLLGVNMWIALMVPGLLAVATAALGMVADDYRESARTLTRRR